jgi:uncharacterized transporter YbjL
VFVSNLRLVGQTLGDINLFQQFGAIATRVRRGDIEMLAHDDTALELGDRVRITARREDMDAISRFFGDSYRALSEIDILSFSLGIGLGLLVGLIPIPMPGGLTFTLGFAGGPLIVALILGALGRKEEARENWQKILGEDPSWTAESFVKWYKLWNIRDEDSAKLMEGIYKTGVLGAEAKPGM